MISRLQRHAWSFGNAEGGGTAGEALIAWDPTSTFIAVVGCEVWYVATCVSGDLTRQRKSPVLRQRSLCCMCSTAVGSDAHQCRKLAAHGKGSAVMACYLTISCNLSIVQRQHSCAGPPWRFDIMAHVTCRGGL